MWSAFGGNQMAELWSDPQSKTPSPCHRRFWEAISAVSFLDAWSYLHRAFPIFLQLHVTSCTQDPFYMGCKTPTVHYIFSYQVLYIGAQFLETSLCLLQVLYITMTFTDWQDASVWNSYFKTMEFFRWTESYRTDNSSPLSFTGRGGPFTVYKLIRTSTFWIVIGSFYCTSPFLDAWGHIWTKRRSLDDDKYFLYKGRVNMFKNEWYFILH